MSAFDAPTLDRVPELRLGAAGFALLVATVGLHVGRTDVVAGAAVLAAATAGCCLVLRLPHALLLGVTAWALLTGFVVNALGQLSFAPADLARLVALVGVAVLASLGGKLGAHRDPRRGVSCHRPSLLNTA